MHLGIYNVHIYSEGSGYTARMHSVAQVFIVYGYAMTLKSLEETHINCVDNTKHWFECSFYTTCKTILVISQSFLGKLQELPVSSSLLQRMSRNSIQGYKPKP